MSVPVVSVALAACDGERYIAEQLESILAQDWPRLEVVVSDDASTDRTAEIVARYARCAPIRLMNNAKRVGLVQNFSRAIAACTGELIALSDQDDIWRPGRLLRLVAGIGTSSLVYCKTSEVITDNGSIRREHSFERMHEFARRYGSGRAIKYLLAENWVVSHTMMFRRGVVETALPMPAVLRFHDGWLALVASVQGGLTFLDEALQLYREHAGSFTYMGDEPSRKSLGRRIAAGDFRRAWEDRCQRALKIIDAALDRCALNEDERQHARRLGEYYQSGIGEGRLVDWWRAGWLVAPYFASAVIDGALWKVPCRAVLGGVLARARRSQTG